MFNVDTLGCNPDASNWTINFNSLGNCNISPAFDLELPPTAFTVDMPALNGWHRGERAIHKKLNYQTMATAFTWIEGDLPEEHREFHTTRLPFVPVTTLDDIGRPWGSILAGRDGKPGFIRSPTDTTLVLNAHVWDGDPLLENAKLFGRDRMLVAGIGIEFTTRRRNKFAGQVSKMNRNEGDFQLEFVVNEAIGNCPKYINVRDIIPHPTTSPKVIYRQPLLSPDDRLPDDVISFIHDSDTVFIGTSYVAPVGDERMFPSHVGMNQRGGRRGFVRVSPTDGRTVVLPDYSGNRLMTSLGNIEVTPLASLTFVSFTTGSVLYLTGSAENLLGPSAQKIMPLQNALTSIHTTGYTLVSDALPIRQRLNTAPQPSPYSPPIRFLAAESPPSTFFSDADSQVSAVLSRIDIHSPSLATFTWDLSEAVHITPGQAAIMDFTSFIGKEMYRHMAPSNPTSVNDDRIRTWTVSTAHLAEGGTRELSLTMREKQGGAVTGPLFSIARKLAEVKKEMLADTRPLELSVKLVGVSGDFTLPAGNPKKLWWFAGGIGLTPFLSMLGALSKSSSTGEDAWDINLVLSTREPEVLLPLISAALQGTSQTKIRLALDVFSDRHIPDLDPDSGLCLAQPNENAAVTLTRHTGRLPRTFFSDSGLQSVGLEEQGQGVEIYMCGPEPFEKAVIAALGEVGVDEKRVKREGFGY